MSAELSKTFNEKAAPSLIDGEAYRLLLEQLLVEGTGYGKVKPVIAHKLLNLDIHSKMKKSVEEQEVELPDVYVVMDPALWKNVLIRRLGLEDVAVKWVRRIVGESDINQPDFLDPGIWTSKQCAFEEDYILSEERREDGRLLYKYYPNPEAYRLCLPMTEQMMVPVPWGTYPVKVGSTLAVREKDVAGLAEALQSIRDGKKSVETALYKKRDDGSLVARFDVYVMEPDFLENNYDVVELSQPTQVLQKHFSVPFAFPANVLRNKDELMLPELQAIMNRYPFDNLPHNGAVFWSEGGGNICNAEDRKIVAVNEELADCFITVQSYVSDEISYTDMLHIVDPYGGSYIETTGRGDRLLPRQVEKLSFFEKDNFWRGMTVRFASNATGTIHVAADKGSANSNFRLYQYPVIANNTAISDVQIITGVPRQGWPYFDTVSKEFKCAAGYDEYVELRERKDEIKSIYADMVIDEGLKTLPKSEWIEWQKQNWFDYKIEILFNHLEENPLIPDVKIGSSWYSRGCNDFVFAKIEFIQEILFSLAEVKRLQAEQASGNVQATLGLEKEKQRLKKSQDILNKYPEILAFDEEITDLERSRSCTSRWAKSRIGAMTGTLGSMLFRLDNTLSLSEKNHLWGRYESYSNQNYKDQRFVGQPDVVEDIVRRRLSGLKAEIENVLGMNLTPAQKPMLKIV